MPTPRPEALRLGESLRLALGIEPSRGGIGERMGSGTGSSLEFQDRRNYEAGDDIRHLDWRAFARTDQLLVRQYREEILPRIELFFDGSLSMAVESAKAQTAVDLTAVFHSAARAGGFDVRLVELGDPVQRVELERFLEAGTNHGGRRPLAETMRESQGLLRPGSLRLVISDFLSPFEAPSLVRALARGGTGLALLQVLGRADAEPPAEAALRLTDSESGEVLDLVVDDKKRARYRTRLERWNASLAEECRRSGARFLSLVAGESLDALVRNSLVRQGWLQPA